MLAFTPLEFWKIVIARDSCAPGMWKPLSQRLGARRQGVEALVLWAGEPVAYVQASCAKGHRGRLIAFFQPPGCGFERLFAEGRLSGE